MNHITHTLPFNNLLTATNEYWKLCTSKDLTDAYTLAAQELAADFHDDKILEIAATHYEMILEFATAHLQNGQYWNTAPVSTLITALTEAMTDYINPAF